MEVMIAAVCAYLLGSIPFGLIAGRRAAGVDLRHYGSGKTGFTNSLRVLGLRRSLPVLVGDLGKGLVAVMLPLLYSDDSWPRAVAALAAVAGHVWPLFAGFRGGRGVLTGAGAVLGLSPFAALVVAPFALGALLLTRIMSVTSITAAALLGLTFAIFALAGWTPWPYALAAVVGAALIIALHRDNLARLRAGTEPRIGEGGGRRSTA